MTMHIRDGGVWKTASPKVKDAGVWKQAQTGSVKDAGVWKTFFNNITYSSSVSTSTVTEGSSVTIYVYPSVTPSNTDLSYNVRAEYGSNWTTSEYSLGSVSNSLPSGPQAYWNGTNWYIVITPTSDSTADAPEYFVVDFFAGYGVYANPVVTSPVVTVNDPAAPTCIWALYGRPEWC